MLRKQHRGARKFPLRSWEPHNSQHQPARYGNECGGRFLIPLQDDQCAMPAHLL